MHTVIMVTTVRITPANHDPEHAWLKNDRAPMMRSSKRILEVRSLLGRRHEAIGTAMGLMTGMCLALAGGLWALALVGYPPSIPLFCSLLLTLVGVVFIIRVAIHEGASASRGNVIDGRHD
ncbi:hypothetical protein AOA80_07530 [Methanomassiliicoccales archaeon RumEn M1]|jgi:hypothetical protein|nr:hypothetical protein AOA80_07530 [Methanomassiliicoccales archaeon RumEn M1]